MGSSRSSAKKARRRAAGPALRYDHAPGARTSGGSGKRGGKGERGATGKRGLRARLRSFGFGFAVFAGVAVAGTALVLGPVRWAGEMWHDLAPDWPGGGYGFAVTAGLLLPVAGALTITPLLRTDWRKEKLRSSLWAVVALPGAAAALMLIAIAMETIRPKRSHRNGTCSAAGEYCWISSHYPYVWAVGLAAAVLGAVAVIGSYDLCAKKRKRSLTPPASAAP
ncbi:hypothetical protein ABZV77_08625 [Streptomyces sp. NPDC004732]|uniref:hypothetical protein n=1 Tax=Streptomyces sp. NPDC004732 TaxID=3154290 RepID=UPI0033A9676A